MIKYKFSECECVYLILNYYGELVDFRFTPSDTIDYINNRLNGNGYYVVCMNEDLCC